jgi:hypothetical protein
VDFVDGLSWSFLKTKVRGSSTLVGRGSPTHNLEVGCLLNFKYEGDNELCVKVFDDTCCRTYYPGDEKDGEV